jgi:dolichyl-phosphate-mannose--protein O-mannosyl transferase
MPVWNRDHFIRSTRAGISVLTGSTSLACTASVKLIGHLCRNQPCA